MENPLSDEQIKKINEIAKLPPEKQQPELQSFIKTLAPEQLEFLQSQQQTQGCLFCSIAEGKIESKKIYQDDSVMAVLDINPAIPGHVLVFPKKHVQVLTQLSDEESAYLFKIANKISAVIFDNLKAEGTNIFIANGHAAGQNSPHAIIHVIPRFSKDGLSLSWKGKKVSEEALDELKKKLENKVKFKETVIKQEIDEFSVNEEEEYRLP